MSSKNLFKDQILQGIPDNLPESRNRNLLFPHAPKRNIQGVLTVEEKKLAIKNALRYFPAKMHPILAPEFLSELEEFGRIYMYRFAPEYSMYARPIEEYPCKTKQAAAIMLMIQNNLDPLVAKYPEELITYGGNGAVFQNWAQYRLCMKYLAVMEEDQALLLDLGHSLGLFRRQKKARGLVVTSGRMIPTEREKGD